MRVYQTYAEELAEAREIAILDSWEEERWGHERECERYANPFGRCVCDER